MRKTQSIRFLSIAALCLFTTFLVTIKWKDESNLQRGAGRTKNSESSISHGSWKELVPHSSDNLLDVQNATLGFSKIFVLSMPDRSDRRDAITLAAYFSGIEIEFIDEVDDAKVPERSRLVNRTPVKGLGSVGHRRGHMNIVQKVANERLQSVLIMEDEVDWDVMIKPQLVEFARGARYLQGVKSTKHSPYGDDWDMLFIGNSGTNNSVKHDSAYWAIPNDPTVVPPKYRTGRRRPNTSPSSISGKHTRLVFVPNKVACPLAYGLSLRGASHILYNQAKGSSSSHGTHGMEKSFSNMCKQRQYGKTACIAVHPTIMGHHRPAVVNNSDGDLDQTNTPTNVTREAAWTENVVYPMRLNFEAYIKGDKSVKSQWPDDIMFNEIHPATLKLPSGGPVLVGKDQYVIHRPASHL